VRCFSKYPSEYCRRDGRPALTDQAELPRNVEDIQDNHHLQDRSGTNHDEQVCCEYCGNDFYADELESHQVRLNHVGNAWIEMIRNDILLTLIL